MPPPVPSPTLSLRTGEIGTYVWATHGLLLLVTAVPRDDAVDNLVREDGVNALVGQLLAAGLELQHVLHRHRLLDVVDLPQREAGAHRERGGRVNKQGAAAHHLRMYYSSTFLRLPVALYIFLTATPRTLPEQAKLLDTCHNFV